MAIQSTGNGWIFETRSTGYAIGFNKAGLLVHRYWGMRLPAPSDYPPAVDPLSWASFNNPEQLTPEEYPGHGGAKFIDPCLKVTFADGVRDVVLRFDRAEVLPAGDQLDIGLCDAHYPLRLTLHYRVHEDYDLIERWASLTNEGVEAITIERIFSAEWHLPPGSAYRLTHLTGRWLDEMHIHHEPLVQGIKVLESRRITTSHHHNPWFAVDRGTADEDQGEVWFGLLAWSGNWKIAAEVTDFESTRVNIGLNDWDFAWRLQPGETFQHAGELCRLHPGRVWQRHPQAARFYPRTGSAPRAGDAQDPVQLVGSHHIQRGRRIAGPPGGNRGPDGHRVVRHG